MHPSVEVAYIGNAEIKELSYIHGVDMDDCERSVSQNRRESEGVSNDREGKVKIVVDPTGPIVNCTKSKETERLVKEV